MARLVEVEAARVLRLGAPMLAALGITEVYFDHPVMLQTMGEDEELLFVQTAAGLLAHVGLTPAGMTAERWNVNRYLARRFPGVTFGDVTPAGELRMLVDCRRQPGLSPPAAAKAVQTSALVPPSGPEDVSAWTGDAGDRDDELAAHLAGLDPDDDAGVTITVDAGPAVG